MGGIVGENRSRKEQLCWQCQYATGGCSWSNQFKPVEGWDATPHTIRDCGTSKIHTYRIYSCPQFIKG